MIKYVWQPVNSKTSIVFLFLFFLNLVFFFYKVSSQLNFYSSFKPQVPSIAAVVIKKEDRKSVCQRNSKIGSHSLC